MKKTFTADKDGVELVGFLSEKLGTVTVGNIKKQLKQREIRVNGVRTDENIVLRVGDSVEIFVPSFMQSAPDIKIVYSDDNIAVADKPVMCETETTLAEFMRSRFSTARPVHRLDMNTTGLVVFALNDEAEKELLAAIKNRSIDKYYSALVWGKFEKPRDRLTAYLKKDPDKSLCYVCAEKRDGYTKIITEYETREVFDNCSRLCVKLVTGKTHQIRAHLAFEGHPIIGDGKYGSNDINRLFPYKYQQLRAERIVFGGFSGALSYLNGKEIKV